MIPTTLPQPIINRALARHLRRQFALRILITAAASLLGLGVGIMAGQVIAFWRCL